PNGGPCTNSLLQGETAGVQTLTAFGDGYALAWPTPSEDNSVFEVRMQVLNRFGAHMTEAAGQGTFGAVYDQHLIDLASVSSGDEILVAEAAAPISDSSGTKKLFLETFDASGESVYGPLLASSTNGSEQKQPAIVALQDGSAFVTWTSADIAGTTATL